MSIEAPTVTRDAVPTALIVLPTLVRPSPAVMVLAPLT